MLLLLVLPLTVITFVSYSSYNRTLQNEINKDNMNSITKVRDVTETTLKECRNQINWVASNKDVMVFMNTGTDDTVIVYDAKNIYNFIYMHLLLKDYIDSIYIYSEMNGQVISIAGRER